MAVSPFPIRGADWSPIHITPPWGEYRIPILAHITQLRTEGKSLEDTELPDDVADDSKIRFVPGAQDNILAGDDVDPTQLTTAINAVLEAPTDVSVQRLYQTLMATSTRSAAGLVCEQLAEQGLNAAALGALFRWIAEHSPDREPVKFAICMLGLCKVADSVPTLLTLGAHEEFTFFVGAALDMALPQEEAFAAKFDLAKSVDGWGRINLVESLAPDADDAFRAWLVREGFRNSIMNEYLAGIAADEGQLLDQLNAPGAKDDSALLDGATDIFIALVYGGPMIGMSGYTDGPAAAARWIELVADNTATLNRAYAARQLIRHAKGEPSDAGWPTDQAQDYIEQAAVKLLVETHLQDRDGAGRWLAVRLAPEVGIDPWPILFDLQANDETRDNWYDLMRTEDKSRVEQVVALAEDQMPLDALASGPALEFGLGQAWRDHTQLAYIVQDLGKFPATGWPLVRTALQGPVIGNRNAAIRVLNDWPKDMWPEDALSIIRAAIDQEPDPKVRDRLQDLLRPSATQT